MIGQCHTQSLLGQNIETCCHHGWRSGENLLLKSSRFPQNALPDEIHNTKRSLKTSNCLKLLHLPSLQLKKCILNLWRPSN